MIDYLSPNAYLGKSDAESIQNAIDAALANGTRRVRIPRVNERTGKECWVIDETIRLPSDIEILFDNAHLVLADGCFCNMFVARGGESADLALKNITLRGFGNAVLDGGHYNGLSEKTHMKDGYPPIWNNNLILFSNVEGFEIRRIYACEQRWWAFCFLYCQNGRISDIEFCANDQGISEDGTLYRGLKRAKYKEACVKNADGIDLRVGCHDIVIENITGFIEDDTVALTGLVGRVEKAFSVEGLPSDIAFVEIRNIVSASFCTNVRLLNQGDVKLHDIVIDGVYDVARESVYADHGLYAVRVGDTRLYGTRHATKDETYNIAIRNVRGAGDYVISLAGAMGNLSMYGIESSHGAKMLLDNRTE